MPKPAFLAAGAIGAVVVIGGVVMLATNKDDTKSSNNTGSNSQAASSTKLDDPEGVYNFFSDPSVTKYPEKNIEFGNGQTLTFEYDGSKTNNDEYATLSYQLYYIQDNGKVIPMGGGNVEGKGKGTFTLSDKVFDSSAKDRSGFLELQGTYDTSASMTEGITGKNVKLGMYPIKFTISE